MPPLLRHSLAVAILPFTVTVLVPLWIGREYDIAFALAGSPAGWLTQIAGATVAALGLVLFGTTLRRFAGEGRGTLAPWDPPRRLVVRGPYRYVRNPMITGVLFVLVGEALVLQSLPHGIWAVVFLSINLIYIPMVEEPALRDRFGDEYLEYCNQVPRLLPTRHPWKRT